MARKSPRFGNNSSEKYKLKLNKQAGRPAVFPEGFSGFTKFNFAFFKDGKKAGQSSEQWAKEGKPEVLFDRLVEFSKKSIRLWKNEKNVYSDYGKFPSHSKFQRPAGIPDDVSWGAFRISSKFRIAGFTISPENHGKFQKDSDDSVFDENVFYIVFLDMHHDFYPVPKKHT